MPKETPWVIVTEYMGELIMQLPTGYASRKEARSAMMRWQRKTGIRKTK